MALSWKRLRRRLKTSLRLMLSPSIARADVQRVLDLMTPYTVDKPLIRLGGDGDGGYLLPDDLDGIAACFSPGVSVTMTFDSEIMARGIPSFMADASVEGLVEDHPLATFDKLFLGPETRDEFISLDDWVARYAPADGDLLLQMDIEGAEYDTLAAASDATLARFRIIVLELHGLDRVAHPAMNKTIGGLLERLNRHFVLCHVHPNNYYPPAQVAGWEVPPLLELTYLRRDRVAEAMPTQAFPHPLDQTNVPDRPDFALPKFWR
ncbi:FkbM family methyltransferase [Sulfitobacter sabulilitoris]|nr:FkbM family methyltransferase [Sulfitobacter sabulilitoris]